MPVAIALGHFKQREVRFSEPGTHLLISWVVVVTTMMGIFAIYQR